MRGAVHAGSQPVTAMKQVGNSKVVLIPTAVLATFLA